MNFNSKKETADKKERQGADDATKLQDEQVNAAEENAFFSHDIKTFII